jgi:DNA-binding MarR family transcriptional regulator
MARRSKRSKTREYVPPPTISRQEFVSDGTDEGFREIIYAMVAGLDSLMACRAAFGKLVGLTGSQFAVLIGIAYRQGSDGVTIRELAEHVQLAQPHVTTEVGRLIRRGYLVKKPHAVDRRSVLVSLSEKGEAAVSRLVPTIRNTNDRLFVDISSAELERVGRTMRKLVANAEAALVELPPRQMTDSNGEFVKSDVPGGEQVKTSRARWLATLQKLSARSGGR